MDTDPTLLPEPSGPLDSALEAFLAGEATPDQLVLLHQAGFSAPDTLATVRRVLGTDAEPVVDVEAVLAAIHHRIQSPHRTPKSVKRATFSPFRKPSQSRWASVLTFSAAVAIVLAGVVLYTSSEQQIANGLTTQEYVTQPGERATITLNDGTRVSLNVATRLTVPADYGDGTRHVDLHGEAQFEVIHDPARPFIVSAGGTLVRDLATTFVVRSYNDNTAMVAVSDGRVAVEPPTLTANTAVTLDAGELVTLAPGGQPTVTRFENPSHVFGWVRGELVLRNISLGEALLELRRWYGVEFRAADPKLLAMDVTITLPATIDMEKLHGMAELLGAQLRIVEDTITIVPRSYPLSSSL